MKTNWILWVIGIGLAVWLLNNFGVIDLSNLFSSVSGGAQASSNSLSGGGNL